MAQSKNPKSPISKQNDKPPKKYDKRRQPRRKGEVKQLQRDIHEGWIRFYLKRPRSAWSWEFYFWHQDHFKEWRAKNPNVSLE